MYRRKALACALVASLTLPLVLTPVSSAKRQWIPNFGKATSSSSVLEPDFDAGDSQQPGQINPAILKALGIDSASSEASSGINTTEAPTVQVGTKPVRLNDRTRATLTAKSVKGSVTALANSGAGLPGVLNPKSALSTALSVGISSRTTNVSHTSLIADWDGREDMTADHGIQTVDFSQDLSPSTVTRSAISEHTIANGFNDNLYYSGDSAGNFNLDFDLDADGPVDVRNQVNLPELVTNGSSGPFSLLNPTAGDCANPQMIVTGIAVNPVGDLGDFGSCDVTGEIIYVSTFEPAGCASNAANQPIRSRIFAFGLFELGGGVFAAGARQILRSQFSNIAGIAVDDDGSLYFSLVDLTTLNPDTGVGSQGGTIFKATELPRDTCGSTNRINRSIAQIPTPGSLTSTAIISNSFSRLTNYSGASSIMGNVTALAAGPNNAIYAAVAASNTSTGDPTQGLFRAPTQFPDGLPSMLITLVDASGNLSDTCTSPSPGQPGVIPSADGRADPAGPGTSVPWRVFVLGNGPDIRTNSVPNSLFAGTPDNTLKLDMQIDFSLYSGIAINEEGSVFVISGGTPPGVGNNPSPNRTEILGFEDKTPKDRRADYVDFRGNSLPNPPSSGGNVGDGDSDRLDHIFHIAPVDGLTLQPAGLSGLSRGFLRYTNRLADVEISGSVVLGLTVPVQFENTSTGPILFENLDPGHQASGGDDQNTPFRGDDNAGAGSPALPDSLNGGFEFNFGGTAASVWNGFFLNSNGNITFGMGSASGTPTLTGFRGGPPKVSAAWTHLNPGSRTIDKGTFPIQALGFANINAFKVRWINVPEKGSEMCTAASGGTSNTFSLTLFDDGVGVDENANQPLNPANPIGNNAVPFDLQEGPTDLRWSNVGAAVVQANPRRSGSGNFALDYSHMDLIGVASNPVISGYSVGALTTTNPPALCEVNLSEAARTADGGVGPIQGQTASINAGLIGEGTESTVFELFDSGTLAAPDFDLRFEGNDTSTITPPGQPDDNRESLGFFGVGVDGPVGGLITNVVPDPFVTTPTTTGLINVIGPATISIFGSGFFTDETTTVCASGGESGPRPGKTVSTSATLSVDVDLDSVPEAVINLTNVTVVNSTLIRATLEPAPGLPGSPFPLEASGGFATITITTNFSAGDNNVFGGFSRVATGFVDLGTRAPVVTSVTPASGDCGAVQNLAITGGSFQFTQFVAPNNVAVSDVIATEIANPGNVIHASSFTVVDAMHLNADFDFGGTSARSFLVQAVSQGGTSRDMLTLPPLAPPPLGNEAGNLINFTCGENFQFNAGVFSVTEDLTVVPVTVTRGDPGSGTVTVDLATSDGTANQVADYTATFATLTFAPGEVSKTVNIPITQDAFVEGNETINLTLSNPSSGTSIGGQSTAVLTIIDDDVSPGPNPIDDATDFVGQHYHDFLNRQGDPAGVAFWVTTITSCGADPACIEVKRINASAAFFLSIEFQNTGFYVLSTQRVAFGRKSDTAALRYAYIPFLKDTQAVGAGVVVGDPGADAILEANKQSYAMQVVSSAPFIAAYPVAQTASQYVDALFTSAMVTPTTAERDSAITAFGAGGTGGRVAALRSVVGSDSVRNAEFNPAFVLLEYYGYLRRNPTDSPDLNDDGYQFWLSKLNSFGGNFVDAELVKAFISSAEYRQRFGTP